MADKIRLRYTRGPEVKFIAHLDLMQTFERAIRRADLPVAYTQGFNPHPVMVFGQPLAVGVTSEAEIAEFGLASDIKPDDFMYRINAVLPVGLRVTAAAVTGEKGNIMSRLAFAAYRVAVAPAPELDTAVAQFVRAESVPVVKETKSGKREIELRGLVLQLQYLPGAETDTLVAVVSAGSRENIRPELLLETLGQMSGRTFEIRGIHRTGLYIDNQGTPADPFGAPER